MEENASRYGSKLRMIFKHLRFIFKNLRLVWQRSLSCHGDVLKKIQCTTHEEITVFLDTITEHFEILNTTTK